MWLINILKVLLRGDANIKKLKKNGLKVGNDLSCQRGVIIDPSHCFLIEIGDNVTLAPNVHILAHDASTKKIIGYTKIAKVKIGNNVFIGAGSIILPGVHIGNNVIIGAGSIVTKNIPSDSVAYGNPARVKKSIKDYTSQQKELLKNSPKYDENYKINNITKENIKKMSEELDNQSGYLI